jgi:uncharacterized protein YjdB
MKHQLTMMLLLLISCIFNQANATDHHVNSAAESIQAKIDVAQPGDRVLIHQGTYNQFIVISGKSGITMTSAGDGIVTVQGDGTADNVINIFNSSSITISNLVVKNQRKVTWVTGIYVNGYGSNIQILNNIVTDVSYKTGAWDGTDNPRRKVVGANPIMIAGTDTSAPLTNIIVSGNEVSYCMTGWNESITFKGNLNTFTASNNIVHHVTNIAIDAYGLGSWPNALQPYNGQFIGNTVYNAICNYTDNGAIYVDGANDVIIANNRIYNSVYGITIGCENQANLAGGTTSGIKVVNNVVYNNRKSGIMIGTSGDDNGLQGDVVNCIVTGNTFLKNATADQWASELVLQNANNISLYNNVFYGLYQVMITQALGVSSNTLGYNIFFNSAGLAPTASVQTGTTWSQISLEDFKAANNDVTSLNVDPMLVNANIATPDFHLQAGSPCINGGKVNFTPLAGEVDLDGQARVQNSRVDIGVDESGTSTSVAVTGVSVSPTSASIAIGGSVQLTKTISPANATNQTVTWSSSNTGIATVNASGLVSGVASGSAVITVTTQDGGFTATSSITVSNTSISVTGVSVSPATATLSVGGTQQLTATVAPSNATNKNVSWSSSNASVASVSSNGLVTGVASGTAVVTVTTQDGGFTATSNITVSGTTGGGLPSPWQTADIGAVAATGSAGYSSGTFTVAGSGYDIASNNDEFRFVYRALSGDGEIKARVASLTNTNALAKAGVMIREGLSASSKYGFCAVTPSSGLIAQLHGNGTGVDQYTASGSAPKWVRVTRVGGTLTCFFSSDGTSWTQMGTRSVGLTTIVYVGLAVTSHNDGTLCTALFDNVSFTGASGRSATNTSLSVKEVKENQLVVYPNPSNKENVTIQFHLSEEQPVKLTLTDLTGRLVHTVDFGFLNEGDHSHTISTASLTAGLYIIKLKTGHSISTTRLVQK